MPSKSKFKCKNCNELSRADARNRRHQRFCSKPECRRASKAASQRRWTARAENQNHFKGPENCERTQQWRKDHPGYQRNKRSAPEVALQEILISQSVDKENVPESSAASALQDLYMSQPAVVIGFVSVLTGCVLQDDLMACARSFMRRGLDILGSHVADCAPQVDPCAKHPPSAHTSDSGLIEGILDTIPQIRQALEASTSSTAVRSSDF